MCVQCVGDMRSKLKAVDALDEGIEELDNGHLCKQSSPHFIIGLPY